MDKYDKIEGLLEQIKNELKIYGNYCSDNLQIAAIKINQLLEEETQEVREIIADELITYINKEQVYPSLFLYSLVVRITSKIIYFEQFIEYVIACSDIKMYTKYFLFLQFRRIMFLRREMEQVSSKVLNWKLFNQVCELFEEELNLDINEIPLEERDPNRIVVVTSQIIGEEHGPTKTTLERCKVLMEVQHKEVLLVNTCDVFTKVGMIPYMGTCAANYRKDLIDANVVEWKGTKIPYFQCNVGGMSVEEMRVIISYILNYRPSRIVAIGGGNLLAYFMNQIVPTVTIGIYPSDIDVVGTRYQTQSGELRAEQKEILDLVGIPYDHVIRSQFTSDFKKQKGKISRAQLGIPEDKFVMTAVGGRLDGEMDDDFFKMLEQVLDEDSLFVCCGRFSRVDEVCKKYPGLDGKFKSLGFQDDMLAVLENIDLFVNPERKGGGISAVEALFKGVPVVTLNYGDIASNVGAEFCVETYDEMIETIRRYRQDKEFYNWKANIGRELAAKLLDTSFHLERLLDHLERRESIKEN